jgi:LMBR1 domain-containing protein 1
MDTYTSDMEYRFGSSCFMQILIIVFSHPGWFLFALFGGIGLAATPLDFWLIYVNRPRHMDAQAFAEAQQSMRQRVNELVEIGELIKTERLERANAGITKLSRFSLQGDKRALAKEEREALLQFKQAVYLLEEDVQDFKDATSNWKNSNPLWPYLALLLGFVSFIISIFWFIHVIVYVYPNPPLAVSILVLGV